ncbi:DUF4157 domain-containing protein [Haliangium sp.]|uniref:eCIS core domain-containing protein n=1 Tax=Haliangium sp. TaxID=2663208 RepID=UPI003D1115A7
MPDMPYEPTEEEIQAALDAEGDLGDEIIKKWDPERLLRLVAKRAGRGEKLDESTRRRYERKLGVDLGRVRIYSGEFAQEITKAHGAEAVTIGTTGMILMSGSPDRSMATTAGRALLAHELTHVAQEQRSLQRKASFGESTPLATEHNEAEAEAAEAEEYAEAAGGESDGESPEEQQERLKELVRRRVLDMFAESERNRLMRNGANPWRP